MQGDLMWGMAVQAHLYDGSWPRLHWRFGFLGAAVAAQYIAHDTCKGRNISIS
jgi:hypothetical protein